MVHLESYAGVGCGGFSPASSKGNSGREREGENREVEGRQKPEGAG